MKKIVIGFVALFLCFNAFGMKKSSTNKSIGKSVVAIKYKREIKNDFIEYMLDDWLGESSFWLHIRDLFVKIKKKRTKLPEVVEIRASNLEELIDYWMEQNEKTQ